MNYIVTIRRNNVHTGIETRVNENPYNEKGYTRKEAEKVAYKLNHFSPVLDARVEPKH